MEPNWNIQKLYAKTMGSNENIIKMQRVQIDLGLLKVNCIAKGYPYESQMEYYKIDWNTLKTHENIMKMNEKLLGSDLLKLNEIARG